MQRHERQQHDSGTCNEGALHSSYKSVSKRAWKLTKACHYGQVRSKDCQDVVHGSPPNQHAVEDKVPQAQFDGVWQPKGILVIVLRVPGRRYGRCRERNGQSLMACAWPHHIYWPCTTLTPPKTNRQLAPGWKRQVGALPIPCRYLLVSLSIGQQRS